MVGLIFKLIYVCKCVKEIPLSHAFDIMCFCVLLSYFLSSGMA